MNEISWIRSKCDKNGQRKVKGQSRPQSRIEKDFGKIFTLDRDEKRYDDDGKESDDQDYDKMYQDVNQDGFLFGNIDHDHVDHVKFVPKFGCKIFKYKLIDDDYDCDYHDYKTDCKLFKPDYGYNLNNENCYSNVNLNYHNHLIKLPNGAIDASACHGGLPLIYSEPHFLGGSDIYSEIVTGLNPIRSEHESFMVIEPVCGGVMEKKFSGQTNVLINQETFNLNQKENNFTNHVLMPIFWFEGYGQVSRKSMKDIWMMKELSEIIGYSIGSIIAAIGFIITIYFASKIK